MAISHHLNLKVMDVLISSLQQKRSFCIVDLAAGPILPNALYLLYRLSTSVLVVDISLCSLP